MSRPTTRKHLFSEPKLNWFKSHHGAPLDPKLGYAASLAGCKKAYATALWWCILDAASQDETRGNVTETHVTAACYELGIDADVGVRLIKQFVALKLLTPDLGVTAWEKRQATSAASSAERVRKHRNKMKRVTGNDETLVTHREEKTREEEIRKNPPKPPSGDFNRFWLAYPEKVGKGAALKAFERASADIETILAGVQRYVSTKPPDRPWCNPSTWLNQQRWLDAPAKAGPQVVYTAAMLDEEYRQMGVES